MLFNSMPFLVFFAIVVLLYYALPHKYRWILLLVASCFFYSAFVPAYLLILFLVIIIDYTAGRIISVKNGPGKKTWLAISIISTCSVLFFFKYFNFVSVNTQKIAAFSHWNYDPTLLKWVLPIGLSFHTFQSLSYVLEVYYGRQPAEKHLGIYATYVMFFPQLVAGPIERPQNLLPQFRQKHPVLYTNFSAGFRLALYGFFKKMVIADNLAPYVDQVYNNPTTYGSGAVILATCFFAVQIYCDFSGYSDI
ncbi:MAG: MBOAT family protein, partial [Taibaiella sp.]|nr:MBOAT family protein [Taibaiella sp.]